MSGKGSAPRPLSVTQSQFDQAFDMIFRKREQCGLCQKPKDSCGCCPTDDGPGQENEATETKEGEAK